jgi:hypothetical protein
MVDGMTSDIPRSTAARPQMMLQSTMRLVQEYDSLMALDPVARWR